MEYTWQAIVGEIVVLDFDRRGANGMCMICEIFGVYRMGGIFRPNKGQCQIVVILGFGECREYARR